MVSKKELTEEIKEDFRIFLKKKKIQGKINKLMLLFSQEERGEKKEEDNPEGLVLLIDSLNNIIEIVNKDGN